MRICRIILLSVVCLALPFFSSFSHNSSIFGKKSLVLSDRGLCDGPIPRPEESYRVWCVCVISKAFIFFRFYFLSMYIWFYSCLIMWFMYFYCYDYVFSLYVYVWLPWLRFFRDFSPVVRQMPRVKPQRRGTAGTLPPFCVVLCISCVVLCIFVLFYVLFVLYRSLYCLCVYVYCTTATGWLPNCS